MQNVNRAISWYSKNYPDRLAIADDVTAVSYSELSKSISYYEEVLSNEGISSKSKVIVIMNNCIQFIQVTLAICNIGATPIYINTQLSNLDIQDICTESNPRAIICESNIKNYKFINENIGSLFKIITIDKNINHNEKNIKINASTDFSSNIVFYTSGSTGRPKGIVIDKCTFDLNERNKKIADSSTYLITRPVYFRAHFSSMCYLLQQGDFLIISKDTSPLNIIKLINKYNVTNIISAPVDLYSIIEEIEENNLIIFEKIHEIVSTGAILTETLKEKLKRNFSNSNLVNLYGLSEVGVISLSNVNEWSIKPKSIGKPAFFNKIQIISDKNEVLDCYKMGEIAVKSKFLMKEYYNNEKLNRDSFVDGYLKTGDIGYLDEDGFLYLVGRKDGNINVNGNHFQLSEIEELIRKHNKVKNIVGVSIRNEQAIDKPVIFIEIGYEDNIDKIELSKEIWEICHENLATYKIPDKIIVLEKFPINSAGKIDTVTLKKQIIM
jgi:acyl-coenzyme A synthetase/AMP-(fatty) acid ligase